MLVSYRWLQDYVDINVSAETLAEKLTAAGIIVDQVYYLGEGLDKCVIGRIERIEPHPNADKLLVCHVNTGQEQLLQVVTGAANVETGQFVPVALPGAVLPDGTEIKPTEFRGIASQGMLLSALEIGYEAKVLSPAERDGILILPSSEVSIGQGVAEALELNDCLLELDLTPNRADCSSMIGLAYEVAAVLGTTIKPLQLCKEIFQGDDAAELISVEIAAPELCSQYSCSILDDIRIQPSPLWLQNRLRKSGIRPINVMVDITNYVMLELGQPLHAFDYDKIVGHKIIVRRAASGEQLITLDEVERSLTDEMLVIADSEKAVGIAGVMGGLDSEVKPDTRRVLLESASFHYASVRRTARALGLNTEAASRFGKGIDQNNVDLALQRTAYLVKQLDVARVVPGVVSNTISKPGQAEITLRPQRVNSLLGTDIPVEVMIDILERLHFKVNRVQGNVLKVVAPTRRLDIKREVDLVEEIARLYGYDNIHGTMPVNRDHRGRLTREQKLRRKTRTILRALGANEIVTYSFRSPKELDLLLLQRDNPLRSVVVLSNPLSEQHSVMRTSLVPGLLDSARYNLHRQQEGVLLFEVGHVFYSNGKNKLPDEVQMVGLVAGGMAQNKTWNTPARQHDFFTVKGIVEALLSEHGVDADFVRTSRDYLHPGRAAAVVVDGCEIGYLGELHPDVVEQLDLEMRIIVAEINHDLLVQLVDEGRRFNEVAPYPAVERDIAVIVDEQLAAADILSVIRETGGELVEDVRLFDVYRGKQIPEGKQSCAFTVRYRASDRTLTDEEVNARHQEVTEALAQKCGAKLR